MWIKAFVSRKVERYARIANIGVAESKEDVGAAGPRRGSKTTAKVVRAASGASGERAKSTPERLVCIAEMKAEEMQ